MRAGQLPAGHLAAPISSVQTCRPGDCLPDRQLGLPALVVIAELDAITTKPLYFLQTIFPFAISQINSLLLR